MWSDIDLIVNKKQKAFPEQLKQHIKDLELSNLYFNDNMQDAVGYADLYLESIGTMFILVIILMMLIQKVIVLHLNCMTHIKKNIMERSI